MSLTYTNPGWPARDGAFDALPGFQKPPPGYGEIAFYWWQGDPITKDRLLWQLDKLAGRGITGLQINYSHTDTGGLSFGLTDPGDPLLFSEAWWELFGWFLTEANVRGMSVSLSDYTLGIGQGWHVDTLLRERPDMAGAVLESETCTLPDGGNVNWPLPEFLLTVTAHARAETLDLTAHVKNNVLCWAAPANSEWTVCAVFVRPIPLSLDPMHPESGPQIAARFFGQFKARFPEQMGRGLNFFFSDELDFGVRGLLWNVAFAGEFVRRKDYNIVPHLAALFMDTGPQTPKIRMDYNDVLVELSEEGYFRPVYEWHESRGMIYGCDHGGRGTVVDEFGDYFRTQRWNGGPGCDQPRLGANVVTNKVASSIAHLYERPRTWLEGFYGSGWGTSAAQLSDAIFRNYAQGQNLLSLHGLYYSTHGGWWEWAPPCNHFRMPYWAHMDALLGCTERLSFLLSQGAHRCDTAIVYPVAPTEAGMDGQAATNTAFLCAETLYAHERDVDFIDHQSLERATVQNGLLCVAGEQYRVLVLPALSAARFSTLEKAREFAEGGGLVVAVGALPEASERAGREDPILDALVCELWDGGLALHVPDAAALLQAVQERVSSDFDSPHGNAHVLHRKVGSRDVYFVYGVPENAECFFRATGRAELWNPWTGETSALLVISQNEEGTRLRLPLGPAQPQLVVFSPGTPDFAPAAVAERAPKVLPLTGLWDFELVPTRDNIWGDFRLPPTHALLGAEQQWFRYRATNADCSAFNLDNADWPRVTYSYGPHFRVLGPVPPEETPDVSDAAVEQWPLYDYSDRFGVEGDPGRQGYHGLKGKVSPDFLALGRCVLTDTGALYEQEVPSGSYYLWSAVNAPAAMTVPIETGAVRPAALWLNGDIQPPDTDALTLRAGVNRLLLRYDGACRTRFNMTGGPVWDVYANARAVPGWYRFSSPPGMVGMTIIAHGNLSAWAGGVPLSLIRTPAERTDGAATYQAHVLAPNAQSVPVALRIAPEPGFYGGAALPEPIAYSCGPGKLMPGDWSACDGLSSYSGGARYGKRFTLTHTEAGGRVVLALGEVCASAEVHVNGDAAGVLVCPPWTIDISRWVRVGENRVDVLVYNTLSNHYQTIPTRYRGDSPSGLLGSAELHLFL